MNQFIKYQSLGNDFILFDWINQSEQEIHDQMDHLQWKMHVAHLCDRHFGIGADGVLILKKRLDSQIEMLIFNSDGNQAEICLNGVRCVAHYLYRQNPGNPTIDIHVGTQTICNRILRPDLENDECQIESQIPSPIYEKSLSVATREGIFSGHRVLVGNPHFVIFQKNELSWLTQNGSLIEQHNLFPQKTNVEFVWKDLKDHSSVYRVLVYERGCGITLACSSGAAAIIKALHYLQIAQYDQPIDLAMLGGTLRCRISSENQVFLTGTARPVFRGKCYDNSQPASE